MATQFPIADFQFPNCAGRTPYPNRQSPIGNRQSRAGFTLLELLIALVMSGILAMSLFGSVYIAYKAEENSKAVIAPIGSVDMALDMIRADLQAAQPPAGVLEGPFEGTQNGAGSGEADTLDFYTNGFAPQHQTGSGEIKHVFLTLEQKGNQQCLVRQVIPNILAQQQPVPDEEIICRNVNSFMLEYYDGEQWQTSWDSTQYNNSLPAAIEVTLELLPPGATEPMRIRRVYALSCVTPPTAATSSSGSGSGTGGNSGGNNSNNKSGGNNSNAGNSAGRAGG